MHNQKKGARHGQKRKRRKERKEAKERKEGKEKTIPGFISKPNISTACAYARVRGAANRLYLLVRGGGRSGDWVRVDNLRVKLEVSRSLKIEIVD
jgi:hypothetical protein